MENAKNGDAIAHDRARRIKLPVYMLVMLSLFSAWQMGVVFYGSNALLLYARTPLPAGVDGTSLVILAGYVLALVTSLFFQSRCVLIGRVCLSLSLVCAICLFLPLPSGIVAVFIHAQNFLCVYLIGIMMCVSITLLDLMQTLLYTVLSSLLAGVFVPLMQNDIFALPFAAFNAFTCAALVGLLAVFLRMPAKRELRFVPARRSPGAPASFLSCIYLLVALSCLMMLFSSSLAGSIRNGVALCYLCGGAGAAVFIPLWKKAGKNPVRLTTVFLMLSALGFLLFIASASYPVLSYIACALTGFGVTVCNLIEFIAAALFFERPTRTVVPSMILIALATVIAHALLLELFRERPGLLRVIYGSVAVTGTGIYLRLEPHLHYLWLKDAPKPEQPGDGVDNAVQVASQTRSTPEALLALTAQERAVADLILRGFTGKEISERMNISINTQKDYRKKLYMKLDVHSRSELFAICGTAGEEKPL